MLICFEGLDGVGKSTIAKTISKEMNIRLLEKPLKSLLELSPEQSKGITERIYSSYSPRLQSMYYLMGYLSVLEDAQKENVIFDRGLLSTYYFSCNDSTEFLFDSIVGNCGTPDLTIILYASIEERLKRIKSRDSEDKDLNKKRLYVDGYLKYFEGVNRYNMPYYLINTEHLNQQEVENLCKKIVSAFLKDNKPNSAIQQLLSIESMEELSKMSYNDLDISLESCLLQKSEEAKGHGLKR